MPVADLVADAYQEPARSEVLRLISDLAADERDQVIADLLSRGDHDQQRRPQFHLLAWACLNLIVQPPSALQTACTERLQHLIPPSSVKQARALARAGTLAIPPLTQYLLNEYRLRVPSPRPIGWMALLPTAENCLRTLVYIGGDAALDALEYLVQQGVGLNLTEGWHHFDQDAYARRIILPLNQGQTGLGFDDRSLRSLRGLEHFTHLTTLNLMNCFKLSDIKALSALKQLEELHINECHVLRDITALGELPKLKHLHLPGCYYLGNCTPLEKATQLERVSATGCWAMWDLNWLRPLQRLEQLVLGDFINLHSVEGISALTQLKWLALDLSRNNEPIPTNTDFLAHLHRLENLSLGGCRYLQDISALAGLTNLTYLSLHDCTALRDLQPLAHLPHLAYVHLERCYQLTQEDLAVFPKTVYVSTSRDHVKGSRRREGGQEQGDGDMRQ